MVFDAVTKYRHCNMPFSNKDKAVMKKFIPIQIIRFAKDTDEI